MICVSQDKDKSSANQRFLKTKLVCDLFGHLRNRNMTDVEEAQLQSEANIDQIEKEVMKTIRGIDEREKLIVDMDRDVKKQQVMINQASDQIANMEKRLADL